MTELKRTPLFALHQKLGARMVPFAGFEMPVQYRGVIDEHLAVRERVGLFDVSHMGQIYFTGQDACAALEWLVTCPIDSLQNGQIRYGLLCNTDGGCVDDVTVHRLGEHEFFLCVNASNIEKDLAWIRENTKKFSVTIDDRSETTGLLALQGPAADSVFSPLTDVDLSQIKRFGFVVGKVAGIEALIARTGYTGSPGFELYVAATDAARFFEILLDAGQSAGIEPAGLGARDTLRLEAALPLYGHELDDTTSPFEAGLERFVKLDRGGFLGAEAIRRRSDAAGLSRKLVGFELLERGIARAEYPVTHQGKTVGVVTSGTHSPSLGKAIGLAYVPPTLAAIGSEFEILVRNRGLKARVLATPFVRSARKKSALNLSGKATEKQ